MSIQDQENEGWEEVSVEEKHKCKYCGAMTIYPDEECYANPNNLTQQP